MFEPRLSGLTGTVDDSHLKALLIFDPVDGFARDRGLAGPRPAALGEPRYVIVASQPEPKRGAKRTPAPVAIEPIRLRTVRNDSGYDLWFGAMEPLDGRSRWMRPIQAGTYVIEVTSEYHRRVRVVATTPTPTPQVATACVLPPGPAYPFPTAARLPGAPRPIVVRGWLTTTSETPIAGASVSFAGGATSDSTTTDAGGQFALFLAGGAPGETVRLKVSGRRQPVDVPLFEFGDDWIVSAKKLAEALDFKTPPKVPSPLAPTT